MSRCPVCGISSNRLFYLFDEPICPDCWNKIVYVVADYVALGGAL